jgi:hypothetical protein
VAAGPIHPEAACIDLELCSLSYMSVDKVATVAASYPQGALLAKIDVESAYCLIPVNPQDWLLNGTVGDPMLPFRLPKCFFMQLQMPWSSAFAPKCSTCSIICTTSSLLVLQTRRSAERHWPLLTRHAASWVSLKQTANGTTQQPV